MTSRTFNPKFLDLPKRPKTGFELVFDKVVSGFALRVPSAGTPTFQVIARDPSNREKRVSIASWVPHGGFDRSGTRLTLEELRILATKVRSDVRAGRDPFETAKEPPWRQFSLRDALEMHIAGGKAAGRIAGSTERGYREVARLHLSAWLDHPISDLTRRSVRERHLQIAGNSGPGVANHAIRLVSACWNRAARQFPELGPSPTTNVDQFRLAPRNYGIGETDVPRLWAAMSRLDPVRRDFYRTILFTGLRRRSAAELRVKDFDPEARTLWISNPKGGSDRAFTLPVCNRLHEVLKERTAENPQDAAWIFPSNSRSQHIEEPREKSLPPPHALRHLYASVAANLVPAYPLKLLLNHALDMRDVTSGYIKLGPEQLRPHAEAVGQHISKLATGDADTNGSGLEGRA